MRTKILIKDIDKTQECAINKVNLSRSRWARFDKGKWKTGLSLPNKNLLVLI